MNQKFDISSLQPTFNKVKEAATTSILIMCLKLPPDLYLISIAQIYLPISKEYN